jgi:PadR family transcriptional regulator PadR
VDDRPEILQGSLTLMILRTLDVLGSLHGYGLARRIEETTGNRIVLNYGTLYPAIVKAEHAGWVRGKWGTSENNRRARFYTITPAGRKQLQSETREWAEAAAVLAAFLRPETA